MAVILKISVFCLLLSVFGCSEETTTSQPKGPSVKVRSQKSAPPTTVVAEEENKDIFSYSPVGQRDPFDSLLRKEAEARQANAPKTPLEKFDLGQFRVQAILIGKGIPRAMASAPDGKNYILKPGLKIGKNGGVITDINKSAIIVEESTIDLAGKLIKAYQSLTIPEKKTF